MRLSIAGILGIVALVLSAAGASRAQEEVEPAADPLGEPSLRVSERFGRAGTCWYAFSAAAAGNPGEETDLAVSASLSRFVVDRVELRGELAVWVLEQPGRNPVGINPGFTLRWHAIERGPWTFFADVGAGVLITSDDVPPGGTSLNFTPGAGVGLTREIGPGGSRLEAGMRWRHVSNARIVGDERNPARDAPLLYIGIALPF
jgi:lipid A 3-O-deacylase